MHAANEKMEGMLAPLIEEDENASLSSYEDSDYSSDSGRRSASSVEVKQTAAQKLKTAAAYLFMTAGAVVSVGAMVFDPFVAVFVMGGLCIVHAPYAAYKEHNIIKLPSLRSLNNILKDDAHKLEKEVDALSAEIDSLQPEAERAADVEAELREMAGRQHCNVDKFVDLVRENHIIMSQMRYNLRQRIVQDVFKIVVSSDKDNDGRFCKVETKMLVLKISLELQEYGVEFDEEKFYKVMSVDPTVARTLTIVRNLIPDIAESDGSVPSEEGSEDDEEEDDAYDMFHMSSADAGFGRMTLTGSAMKVSLSIPRRTSVTGAGKSIGSSKEKNTDVRIKTESVMKTFLGLPSLGLPIPSAEPGRVRKRDFLMRVAADVESTVIAPPLRMISELTHRETV